MTEGIQPFHLATGNYLDRWARLNGARPRKAGEADADYRLIVLLRVGKWAFVHPEFGQSVNSERAAIEQCEADLRARKLRFNAVARVEGEPEFTDGLPPYVIVGEDVPAHPYGPGAYSVRIPSTYPYRYRVYPDYEAARAYVEELRNAG